MCSQVDVSCVLVNGPPSTEGGTRTTGYVALRHPPAHVPGLPGGQHVAPRHPPPGHDQVTPVGATSGGSGSSADRTSESRNTCVARSLAWTFLSCPRSLDSTSEVHTWELAPAHIPTFLRASAKVGGIVPALTSTCHSGKRSTKWTAWTAVFSQSPYQMALKHQQYFVRNYFICSILMYYHHYHINT